jgi:hypothetical protein
MRRHAKTDFDHSTIAYDSFAGCKIDLDILMIKKCMIEGMERFIYCFLGHKKEPSCTGILAERQSFSRRCHQLEQVGGQGFSRLDVYAERANITLTSDGRHRYVRIVRERADDPCRPDRRPRRRFRQCASGMSRACQEFAGNDPRGTAGAPDFDDACGKRGGLLRHQSMFIAHRDQAMADRDARETQAIEGRLKGMICRDIHVSAVDLFRLRERT